MVTSYLKNFTGVVSAFFNSAKALDLDDDDSEADEYVSFKQLRICNCYLCVYATMFDAFCKIDTFRVWFRIHNKIIKRRNSEKYTDSVLLASSWVHIFVVVLNERM